jgi:L-lactate dehydrogenase complex protein LldG
LERNTENRIQESEATIKRFTKMVFFYSGFWILNFREVFEVEKSARDEILGKLKSAPREAVAPRPERPALKELSLTGDELIEIFSKNLVHETGIVHRVKDRREALEKLSQIAQEEGLKKVMIATDDVVAPLNLVDWGKKSNVRVMTPRDFGSRDSYVDAVFEEADAGVTGADFAVAESGTLGLVHNRDRARLVSLAPILHIAIVPVERIVAVYEQVLEKVFGKKEYLPSQFCFITGPSMTADIRGIPFKGMHGPRKVIVILMG